MSTTPTPPRQEPPPSPAQRSGQPVQTGALPGGQPGVGANTSPYETGQSNVDASVQQGTEYGKDNLRPR